MKTETQKSMQVGDVVWYRTGNFTATRVRILSEYGHGGARTFVVYNIDRAPSQDETTEWNRHIFETGGMPIAARKCEPLSPEQQRAEEILDSAYDYGMLEESD